MKTDTPEPYNYALWKHMHEEHGLTLLESELSEIEDHSARVKGLQERVSQYAQEREHNAMQALMWRSVADRLALLLYSMNFGDSFPAILGALAEYEKAKKCS